MLVLLPCSGPTPATFIEATKSKMAFTLTPSDLTWKSLIIDNCQFISRSSCNIAVIIAKEPLSSYRAIVVKTENGKRTAVFSESADTIPGALQALHDRSAEAVQDYIKTNGFNPVRSRSSKGGHRRTSTCMHSCEDDENDSDSAFSASGGSVSGSSTVTMSDVSDDDMVSVGGGKSKSKKASKGKGERAGRSRSPDHHYNSNTRSSSLGSVTSNNSSEGKLNEDDDGNESVLNDFAFGPPAQQGFRIIRPDQMGKGPPLRNNIPYDTETTGNQQQQYPHHHHHHGHSHGSVPPPPRPGWIPRPPPGDSSRVCQCPPPVGPPPPPQPPSSSVPQMSPVRDIPLLPPLPSGLQYYQQPHQQQQQQQQHVQVQRQRMTGLQQMQHRMQKNAATRQHIMPTNKGGNNHHNNNTSPPPPGGGPSSRPPPMWFFAPPNATGPKPQPPAAAVIHNGRPNSSTGGSGGGGYNPFTTVLSPNLLQSTTPFDALLLIRWPSVTDLSMKKGQALVQFKQLSASSLKDAAVHWVQQQQQQATPKGPPRLLHASVTRVTVAGEACSVVNSSGEDFCRLVQAMMHRTSGDGSRRTTRGGNNENLLPQFEIDVFFDDRHHDDGMTGNGGGGSWAREGSMKGASSPTQQHHSGSSTRSSATAVAGQEQHQHQHGNSSNAFSAAALSGSSSPPLTFGFTDE
ncbi:hypothetical protein B0H66DRAFT_210023 [Apodospora peruviana]|uniref:Uncharacterized protein n=1 Tax=Apodospora peruviana TaxID=516989 RepID=A0AAE0M7X1_9PEZI|nr:hypothetical protein B0H66DRAFT_210023 [Apodospora peruviana]